MSSKNKKRIIVGITGASGVIYGKALIKKLEDLKVQTDKVAVIFSENGRKVWSYEVGDEIEIPAGFRQFEPLEIDAPPASGSAGYTHMIICPCSMATLARIANGISTDLITRAADVMLKERRKLILVSREMPLSLIHIRNMETITLAGGIICPASPAFYSHPENLEEAINTVIEKVLSLCGLEIESFKWGGH
jgi:flavin prenyltransferase